MVTIDPDPEEMQLNLIHIRDRSLIMLLKAL